MNTRNSTKRRLNLLALVWLELARLLLFLDLLCLVDLRGLRGRTLETQPNDALRRRLVEFLVFNLIALVCLELALLVLGLLACFTLIWFGWFG